MTLTITHVSFAMSLFDRHGSQTTMVNLESLTSPMSCIEEEYLNEHFLWDAEFIDHVTVTSIQNNHLLVDIYHTGTLSELQTHLENFIKNEAPYHSYLDNFYEDEDEWMCSASIDSYEIL